MQSPDRPLVILPAAGYGGRIGCPESEEILPLRGDQPLINQAFEKCIELGWPELLVTREEKVSLLKHAENFVEKGLELSVCLVGETKDWSESVLRSEAHWHDWNLVVLPDTECQPQNIWEHMWESRNLDTDLIVARHKVKDSSHWGVLKPAGGGLNVGEKQPGEAWAWGLYMFSRDWGVKVLSAQLESLQKSRWVELEGCRTHTLELDLFQDLTRGS
jgi:dTDP-glucose pyrophosphorylase